MKNVSVRLTCWLSFAVVSGLSGFLGFAQTTHNYAVIRPGEPLDSIVLKAARVAPSARQTAWQKLETIAFIHFGINTFMDQEWGKGTEDPRVFNPTDLDARQWVRVIKDAGMKLVIITAKHHDGFCLWPSRYTEHSVKNSPWRDGKGDVVRELSEACREAGLKFGIYLSPWDRHEKTYGDSPVYNRYFLNQLRELLTNYGEVSEVWFDGANAEGPNGKKQVYDWPSYYGLIRMLQPAAVIAIMGPDVRWVGTESGAGRETEWSVVPGAVRDLNAIADSSQQTQSDGAFIPRDLTDEDLGSRSRLAAARTLSWYPAETDVSIRPGWFYHESQDELVKSPAKLVDIYYSSVGRNSVLLLNIPPDKRGRITDYDIRSLEGMKNILAQTFGMNFAVNAHATASSANPSHTASMAVDDDDTSYWTPAGGKETATLEVDLQEEKTFDRASIMEQFVLGQRVESFHLDAWREGRWTEFTRGTTIGYKRLLRFPPVTASKVRLVIEHSRTNPTIASFSLFKSPPRVQMDPPEGSFEHEMTIRLSTDIPGTAIYYTLDESSPTKNSPRYDKPIVLARSASISAVAGLGSGLSAEMSLGRYIQCIPVKSVKFENPPSPKYPGSGPMVLVDGKRGSLDFHDKRWIGFQGDDVSLVLDLGSIRPVREVSIGFLQQQGSWIFLPQSVRCETSEDGTHWKPLPTIDVPLQQTERVVVRDFSFTPGGASLRFVKFVARNIGQCPSWHSGAGDKAWLFVDEVVVR